MIRTKPRRIAVIGLKGLPAFGGAAAVGENIIDQLKDDFSFTVLSVSSHTSMENTNVNDIKQIVFKNHGIGSFNTFIYYWKCLFHILFNHYDLIHLHHAESGFITPFLRLKNKVLVTFHGIYCYSDPKFSSLQNWFFRFSERFNVLFANVVISVSKPDKKYIDKKYRTDVLYIPNGMNLSNELNKIAENKTHKDYILFAAGRIYQIKGLHLLLDALKLKGIPNRLLIAGDIDQVPEYKKGIEILSKELNVEYLGLIKNKGKLMEIVSNAKLFIFPSLTEAMSMMLLEVVSMITPIIASDIPSNRAIFAENEILFFKSNDSFDLAEKIRYALDNPLKMESMAKRAYEKLKSNYTWEIISEKYKVIYNNLLQ
ncbi:MAG: glycosyltransferase family 4 protein [Bacteroidetes bacterium]|nr:glycosyltransferase family 4 protein [Bacteroidota bacterium]